MYTVVDDSPVPSTSAGQGGYTVIDDAPKGGILDTMGREAGIAARGAINGITNVPGMLLDVPSHLVNAAGAAIQDLKNTPEEEIAHDAGGGYRPVAANAPLPSQLANETVNQGLSAIGVPAPATSGERVLSDIAGALTGARQMMGGAAADSIMRQSPGLQYMSAASGAGAAGEARENGASPTAQLGAALLGGMAPAGLQTMGGAVKSVGNAGALLAQPFTQGGRERIVGNALQSFSTDPETVMQNLGNFENFVPGSTPTTGEVAKDYGIIAAQRGLKNLYPADFADRLSQQNLARNVLLDSIAKTPTDLAAAKEVRDATTGPLRDAAFQNSQPVNTQAITSYIDNLAAAPENSGQTVQRALDYAKNDLIAGKTDPRALYEARKDLGYAMGGDLAGERADYKFARKQLMDVRNTIDQQVESSAPGFSDYLNQYKAQSQPINQMETAQDIQKRVMLSAPDPTTGRDFFSQPKWSNVVQANRADLAKVMAPDQMTKLDAITADLDRGSAINNPAIRPLGSDTIQNLSTANVIGNVLSQKGNNPFTKTLGRSLTFLYHIPEEATQKLLVDAMLDPSLARGLLAKATPENVTSFGNELKRRAIAAGYGTAIGAATQQ